MVGSDGPTIHVLRTIVYVLFDRKVDHLDEMIPALRKLEREIEEVVDALQRVIRRCHVLVRRRAAR